MADTLLQVMAIRTPSSCRKFRAAVIPLLVFLLMVALPGLFCVVLVVDGLKFDRHALAGASVFVPVLSAVMAWLLSALYPASFSADGIYGHSFWGIRRYIHWRDIADARTFRLLNLAWLRIYTVDNRVTWLALFQSDKAKFRQEVQRLAPAGSPVLNHIRNGAF
jgi:hypothetical protein